MDRTSISACLAGSDSFEVTVPSQPRKNPSGTDTNAGLVNGNQWKSTLLIMALSDPDTAGENTISTTADTRPPVIDHTEPRVLNRFQYSEYRIDGRLALAAMANASDTRKAMLTPLARMPPMIASNPITTEVIRATMTSERGAALPSLSTEL